jgi:hypothetical protein
MPRHEPTVFDKLKMGAIMGGTVGLCIGFVYGAFTLMRVGPGQHGYLGTLGRSMASSAGFFGLLMSVGAVIRTEGERPLPIMQPLSPSRRVLNRWHRHADGTLERDL